MVKYRGWYKYWAIVVVIDRDLFIWSNFKDRIFFFLLENKVEKIQFKYKKNVEYIKIYIREMSILKRPI